MKTIFFFRLTILAVLYLLLKSDSCGGGVFPPSPPTCFDEFTGTWVSDYFEHNGLDYTNQYKMTLVFDDECQCTQTLKKPGNLTISETLPYSKSGDGKTLTIGSAVIAIEKIDPGYELVLRYESGQQPGGFIVPWKATMRMQ